MKFLGVMGALLLVSVQSMPSAAQTVVAQTVGAQAANDSTPTVTIINKSAEAPRETALPELKVSPAVETPSVTPAQTRADTRADVPAGAAAPVTVAAPAPANPNASVVTPAASTANASGAVTPAAAPPAEPAVAAAEPPPEPTLKIDIDLARQSMTVSEHGEHRYSWVVSTAAYGYRTPTGTFKPTWMSKMWYSRQYDYAPMPHAVFFHQGVAIHATYATRSLGRPASHGCVRLAPKNAATLFKLVSSHGKERTQIVVHGRPDHSNEVATNDRYERLRRGTAQRYMPASAYAQQRAYASPQAYAYGGRQRGYYQQPQRRYQPRGLYNSYSYGYGF